MSCSPPRTASLRPVGVLDLEEPAEKEFMSLPQSIYITKIIESLSSYLQAGDPKNPTK